MTKIKQWKTKTKVVLAAFLVLVLAFGVLSLLAPSQETMAEQAQETLSENTKENLIADQDRDRKKVSKTFNDLLCIKYMAYSVSGSGAVPERYVGFCGMVFDVTEQSYRIVQNTYLVLTDADGKTVASSLDGADIKAAEGDTPATYNGQPLPEGYALSVKKYQTVVDRHQHEIASELKGDKIAKVINSKDINVNGTVYKSGETFGTITGKMVNYVYRMLGCGQGLLNGVKLTLLLTVTTVASGLILSVFLALGKISKHKWISGPCGAYIFFFRGTPLLIQLFCIYYAVPGICGFSWTGLCGDVYSGAFLAAYISFSLNSAAYCAEIVRAAILSIDKGQSEAAKALGMTYGQTMSRVIIPQSIGRLIPPIANEFIMILKDVSLVFAISLLDITTISKNIATIEGDFMVYFPALIVYLIITAVFTYIFNRLEKRFSAYL